MDSARLRRSFVALIAAYAVAIQALLLAFGPAPVSPETTQAGLLCLHDGQGQPDQPARPDPACAALCAALGHGVAGPVPPVMAVAVVAPLVAETPGPAAGLAPPRRLSSGPQNPRGPPLA